MLTVIHGNDTAQSRKNFLDEKQKYPDAILTDADKIDLTSLAQIFEGGGLFGETKYLFIEQFFSKRKKSGDYKAILSYLEKNGAEHTIILWEGKELERTTLNDVKKANVKIFKLPQTLFQFLDAIKPQNSKMLITLFHQTIQNTETEMLFFMLVRQLRILLALSGTSAHTNQEAIEELKRLAPWQKGKLEQQANAFETLHLIELYEKLFKIELGQKTGTLNNSLVSAIDFFLLEV